MLIAAGNFDINMMIEGILLMAKDENSSHEHNQDKEWKHEDGWGAAFLENNAWRIVKSTNSIIKDRKIEKLRRIKTKVLVIHARKKTKGRKTIKECHPFFNQDKNLIFMHNGTITGKIGYQHQFRPQGTTDSEKLFLSILSDLKQDNFKIITTKINSFNFTSGTNTILSSPDYSIISVNYRKYPKYYQMAILKNKDSIIISSEKLKNLIGKNWKFLKDKDLVKINHDSLKIAKLNA